MNTPRYKASSPMQTEFITNADGCGDHLFTQLVRKGNVAVYRRDRVGGTVFGYETIIIKTVKAGTVYVKGGKATETDTESYPGAASFGKTGFSYITEKDAMDKFNDLVKKEENKTVVDDEPMTLGFVTSSVVEDEPTTVVKNNSDGVLIPSGEFTQADFAEVNNLPPRGSVYNLLKSMIEKGSVKESRRVSFGRGRPTVMYRGV